MQNLIFRFLQSRQKVQIWLFEHNDLRIEGRIIVCPFILCLYDSWGKSGAAEPTGVDPQSCADAQGFDEYMNLVLDEAEEVSVKKKTARKPLGESLGPGLLGRHHVIIELEHEAEVFYKRARILELVHFERVSDGVLSLPKAPPPASRGWPFGNGWPCRTVDSRPLRSY